MEDEVEETFSLIKARLDSIGTDSSERNRRHTGKVAAATTAGLSLADSAHSEVVKCHSGKWQVCNLFSSIVGGGESFNPLLHHDVFCHIDGYSSVRYFGALETVGKIRFHMVY